MKELSIEEKARRYDEAIKIAEALYKKAEPMSGCNVILEKLFPELKESEDERIRKALIMHFKNNSVSEAWSGLNIKKVLAWLEKQGEKQQKTLIWKHWKNDIAGNGEGEPIYLIKQGNTYSLSSCLPFEGYYIELSELDKLLSEKQGEQKPVDEAEPKFHIGDKIRFFRKGTTNEEPMTITKIDEKGYWSDNLFICNFIDADKRLKLVERKSADKVESKQEPKFKTGTYVVYLNDTYMLEDDGKHYILTAIKKNTSTPVIHIPYGDEDYTMRKWTIQDAKDGDVLATENFIFIFKNIDNGNGVHYYCHYEISKHEDDNQFGIALPQSLMGIVGNNISHYSPAAKEQRDQLKKAMADAGYTFDFDKKELKKIEQKPAENKGHLFKRKCSV